MEDLLINYYVDDGLLVVLISILTFSKDNIIEPRPKAKAAIATNHPMTGINIKPASTIMPINRHKKLGGCLPIFRRRLKYDPTNWAV